MKKIESVETAAAIVPMDIRPLIYEIRGRQVMLDRDLAALYGVLTKNLNKAVKRNVERFPEDFMFQLSKDESLRFQNGTLNGEGDSAWENGEVLRFQTGTLKTRTWKAPEVSALCLYRERHSDVVERFAVRKGDSG